MTVAVELAIDEPIVTVTFEGALTPEAVEGMQQQLARLLTQMGMFYVLVDVRGTGMTFGEALTLLEGAFPPGATGGASFHADPRIRFVFLGQPVPDDPTNRLRVPVFASKDAALAHIHADIANMGDDSTR